MKYIAFIYMDNNELTASVPDLPGCVSEGFDFEELSETIQDAVELWLEDEELPISHPVDYYTDTLLEELEIPLSATRWILDVKKENGEEKSYEAKVIEVIK